VTVDLSMLDAQDTHGAGWDTLFQVENLIGSAFGDTLSGNFAANSLTGGLGADVLTGGAGNDRFVYTALADSTAAAADLVTDFEDGKDKLDLSAIDANGGIAGDQAFHLGATAGHTGDVVLAYDAGTGRTSVSLYVDGDASADAVIWLAGNHLGLGTADFTL
jgi:Ca2+-binding RTX toxin-like protein